VLTHASCRARTPRMGSVATWWTGSCWHDINLHLDVSAQYTLAKAIGTTREQLMGNLRDLALLLAPSSMVM
jgi:hypothetical protein